MTAPTPNRTVPETEKRCVVLIEKYGRRGIACCSPTPAKYPATNTHGTGPCMRSRENFDSRIVVAWEVWLQESIGLTPSHFATPIHFCERTNVLNCQKIAMSLMKPNQAFSGMSIQTSRWVPVIYQDVVPIRNVAIFVPFAVERCKRRRGKSAPWKSLRLSSTFAPQLLLRVVRPLRRGTTC
jgi:hypothetical protein